MACYKGALRAGGADLDREQHCRLRLTLCTVHAAEKAQKVRAGTDSGGSRFSSTRREQQQREEVECFSALLLEDQEEEEGGCCSTAVDDNKAIAEEAHLTSGLFRLCEEWDVSGALHHFLAVTACGSRRRRSYLEEQTQEKDQKGRVPHEDDPAWGAVWLSQVSVSTIHIDWYIDLHAHIN